MQNKLDVLLSSKFFEVLKTHKKEIKGFATGVLLILVLDVIIGISPLWAFLFENLSKKTLALIILGLLILLFLSVVKILRQANKDRLKFKAGFYWDANFNPYCDICKSPISFSVRKDGKGKAMCRRCKIYIPLKDEFGDRLTIQEFQELVKTDSDSLMDSKHSKYF